MGSHSGLRRHFALPCGARALVGLWTLRENQIGINFLISSSRALATLKIAKGSAYRGKTANPDNGGVVKAGYFNTSFLFLQYPKGSSYNRCSPLAPFPTCRSQTYALILPQGRAGTNRNNILVEKISRVN